MVENFLAVMFGMWLFGIFTTIVVAVIIYVFKVAANNVEIKKHRDRLCFEYYMDYEFRRNMLAANCVELMYDKPHELSEVLNALYSKEVEDLPVLLDQE